MPSAKCRPFCWYLYACVSGLPQPHLLLLFWSKFKFKFFIELTATSAPEMWGLWWQSILYLKKKTFLVWRYELWRNLFWMLCKHHIHFYTTHFYTAFSNLPTTQLWFHGCEHEVCLCVSNILKCWSNGAKLRSVDPCSCNVGPKLVAFNSVWPSDAIWRQGSGSIHVLAEVMACCLAPPSH